MCRCKKERSERLLSGDLRVRALSQTQGELKKRAEASSMDPRRQSLALGAGVLSSEILRNTHQTMISICAPIQMGYSFG